jgi:hypothetical protein
LQYLFDITKKPKNLALLVTALLQEKPIVLISENDYLLDLVVKSLELFVPHRSLSVAKVLDQPINPKDSNIIMVHPSLAKMYKTEIFINIDKKSVSKGGTTSLFVLKLLQETKGKPISTAIAIINQNITNLLDKVYFLTKTFFDEGDKSHESRKKAIEIVSTSLPEAFDIIIDMTEAINPVISTTLRKEVSVWKESSLKFMKNGW